MVARKKHSNITVFIILFSYLFVGIMQLKGSVKTLSFDQIEKIVKSR